MNWIIEPYVMPTGESNRFDQAGSWYAGRVGTSQVTITLNGEPFQLDQPLSVTELLEKLEIDPRRVAVEHNLTIIKRHTYTSVVVGEGDRLEIVNAVGGG
jgi:sulfur carrier protein